MVVPFTLAEKYTSPSRPRVLTSSWTLLSHDLSASMPSQKGKGSDPESSKCRFDTTAADADTEVTLPTRTVAAVAPTSLDRVLMTASQAATDLAGRGAEWAGCLSPVCSPSRLMAPHDGAACVSLLLAEGAPPHVVQQIVGHSAIDVTMTIYAHASLDEKRTALSRLGERLA